MKNIYTIFTYILIFTCVLSSEGQIDWVKYEGNPVLTKGSAGEWDDANVVAPCVIKVNETYHMWYDGNWDNPGSVNVGIGHATSADGITWEKDDNNPVLIPDVTEAWELYTVTQVSVLFNDVDSIFQMWYMGYGLGDDDAGIGHATSPDGSYWIRDTLNNPVLSLGSSGSWDDFFIVHPSVVYANGTYHMWYDGWSDGSTSTIKSIGHATSADGINWEKDANNPVLSPDNSESWDFNFVRGVNVLFDGGKFHMWYTGGKWFNYNLGYAFSTDGINWKKYNDYTTDEPLFAESDPVMTRGEFRMWDSWSIGMNSVILNDSKDGFKMWYTGTDNDFMNSRIGYATAPAMVNVPDNYETIQAAIDAAEDGNVVLVEEGTYYENINFKGKAITVASRFYMDGDTSHITNTIIDGSLTSNPDSGSVVYLISGEDTTSVLMGFTITNGTGTRTKYTYEGAQYDMRGGGGILCYNSGGRFIRNRIVNNSVTEPNDEAAGGGFIAGDIDSDSWIILEHNEIMSNTVSTDVWTAVGGGVYMACNGKLMDNIISNNSCTGNGYWAGGGGVHTYTSLEVPCKVIISGNQITHNTILGKISPDDNDWAAFGGGIKVYRSKVQILNNDITDNFLQDFGEGNGSGGGIYMYLADDGSVISGNTIANNTNGVSGIKYGGGIGLGTGNGLSITNNIISGNSASYGGGIRLRENNAEIINNTIVNNTASSGAGGLHARDCAPVIVNSIVCGNHADTNPQIGGTFSVRYSDVEGGYSGQGNIDANPSFADENFNLSDTSACVGNGTDSVEVTRVWYTCPETDQNGNIRPHSVDEFVDIGAIESPYSRVLVGMGEFNYQSPIVFRLFQNYPNPFNPVTTISYQLPVTSSVDLSIYNLLGQKVATLVDKRQQAGIHQVEWDATVFSSGVYYYRIEAGNFVETRKMIYLK